jgi:hypothetical protein
MSPSYAEVESRLIDSYRGLVADVPEYPPVPWSAYVATREGRSHHWHRIVAIAASIVLIVLVTTMWAAPSAGARYHGAEVLRVGAPGLPQNHGSHSCRCSSTL